jgi:hypothetical protein
MPRIHAAQHGNTLALIITCVGVLLLLLGYFAINYSQLMGTHKEAQTAIDAASLQAALDIGKVVVDGPLGRIALVDDPAGSGSAHPVQSLNSVLGTLRLDALIAHRLQNNSILYLVKRDLTNANQAKQLLADKLRLSAQGGSGAYDKNGQSINIKDKAYQAYLANSRRLGGSGVDATPRNFTVTIGGLNSPSHSGIPIPTPTIQDPVAYSASNSYTENGITYYKSGVDLQIPGISGQTMQFAALGKEPALVDNSTFESSTQSIPSVVQVSAEEPVSKIAKNKKQANTSAVDGYVQVISTAQAGGRPYAQPSGTLTVAFPEGFPGDPTGSGTNHLSFRSVHGIINGSQLDLASDSPESKYNNWNGKNKGKWFRTSGPVPGSGSLDAAPYKGISGREQDDPSVVLSFLAYDWMRSLGIRPNVNSVVDAFKYNLQDATENSSKLFSANNGFTQCAYAAGNHQDPVTVGVLTVDPSGEGDARDLTNFDKNPEAYNRQQARMWGYLPADSVLQPNAPLATLQANGDVLTTDGNPWSTYYELRNKILQTNYYGYYTANNARALLKEIFDKKKGDDPAFKRLEEQIKDSPNNKAELEKSLSSAQEALAKKIVADNPRLANAVTNGKYAMTVSTAMFQNMKVLSGGGIKKISENHFRFGGADFWPATKLADRKELEGDGIVATGQEQAAPGPKDWCAVATGPIESQTSQLFIYKRTQDPIIGRALNDQNLLQPAFAQSVVPINKKLKFIFQISGGSEKPGDGLVKVHSLTTSPFGSLPTPKGQAQYQNTSAIVVPSPSDPSTEVEWQVQARDLHANAFPANSSANSQPSPGQAAVHYSANTGQGYNTQWCDAGSGQNCPLLAAEWSITCPIPIAKPTVEVPPVPAPMAPAPPPAPYVCQNRVTNVTYTTQWVFFGFFAWPMSSCTVYFTCAPPVTSTHS